MYMVVETGGKQVKVSEGDILTVERIEGSLGDSIKLENVKLFVEGDVVVADKNSLSGSLANAVIENHGRLRKIYSFRFKRRKKLRIIRGHRQHYTQIKVTELVPPKGVKSGT